MKKINYLPIFIIVICVLFFFRAFVFQAKLPIPSDTIIGLYHPFRDLYAKQYPNGIPFKNFLITDPVRQQYVWKELAISIEKKLQLPLWNPYLLSGTPLLANFQSAVFFPLNFLFFILPFSTAWSISIVAQVLLAGLFMFFYLRNIKVNTWAAILGSITFSFCGFNIAWMEWNTIGYTGLWLPLILLSIDKVVLSVKNKEITFWSAIFLFSLICSFFAGHLQTFFYVFLVSLVYWFARWIKLDKKKSVLFLFIILNLLFIIITSIQWIPTFQFILQSARDVDLVNWQTNGWFIPWEHAIQFIVPDFFGNPTTLNYWGVWNYGEFIGYVGIMPLIMAIFALFFRRDKKTLFMGMTLLLSLIFAFPTFLATLPFVLKIPFLSTAQPTRLLFVADFSLAILAALGFDYFMKNSKKGIIYVVGFLGLLFILLWGFIVFGGSIIKTIPLENILVVKNNLVIPTIIFIFVGILLIFLQSYTRIPKKLAVGIYIILFGLALFDNLRFAQKFTPFTAKEYLFPSTQVLAFLQKQKGEIRIMTTDSRILPPNFSTIYRLQSIEGYDPLYLLRYGELIAASERGKPDINPPFGFNKIITPHNYNSPIINLLGVKYILSLSDISSPKLKKVFQEGQTRVYENNSVLPRAFFVKNIYTIIHQDDKQKAIDTMLRSDFDLKNQAVVEYELPKEILVKLAYRPEFKWSVGKATISYYSENIVTIKTENNGDGFLVFTDSFYPTWHMKIDGIESKIYRTDYNFRGVFVPKGKHTIEFYISLL